MKLAKLWNYTFSEDSDQPADMQIGLGLQFEYAILHNTWSMKF